MTLLDLCQLFEKLVEVEYPNLLKEIGYDDLREQKTYGLNGNKYIMGISNGEI